MSRCRPGFNRHHRDLTALFTECDPFEELKEQNSPLTRDLPLLLRSKASHLPEVAKGSFVTRSPILVSPDPSLSKAEADPARFRDAMSRVAGAVHLIGTDGVAGRGGLTATAVTSVSDHPPTLLVCLNKTSRTAAILTGNGAFTVNTLGAGQQELANVFAGRTPARGAQRFEHGKWQLDTLGQPYLVDALVGFSVRVSEVKPVASHLVVIGEIVEIRFGAAHAGLVYTRRAYHAV
jgi:flavin reductase (DIM6/NTAB) family NADH-FMN oxidoreductase RutF